MRRLAASLPALALSGVVVLCLACPAAAQEGPRTLAQVLAAERIDGRGLPEAALATTVTEFALDQDSSGSLVACSTASGEDRRVRLHVRDNSTGTWRSATIDAATHGAGAVTQVRRGRQWLLVDTQPAEADHRLLFVNPVTLEVGRATDGALLAVLPDDALVLRENAGRFVPTRPVAVSLYLPGPEATGRLHPVPPWSPAREAYVDRVKRAYAGWKLKNCIAAGHHCNAEQFDAEIVSDVRFNGRGTRLAWIMRFGPPPGAGNGPVDFHVHVLVACDRDPRSTTGTCRERAFGSFDGPDGRETTALLESALARPGW